MNDMNDIEEKYKHHESMGMIGVSRISGYNDCMHGTDVPHSGWLELTIYKGTVKRGLHQEWYSEDGQYVRVQLTHSQFSEMISNMNCGNGVPCTVKSLMGKRMESPKQIDRTGQFSHEFKEDMKHVASEMDEVIKMMEDLYGKSGGTKKEKEAILGKLRMTKQHIGSNMPFVEKQFGRCITKAQDDAKRNIEGHMMNIALSAAKRGLVTHEESQDAIELYEGISSQPNFNSIENKKE